MRELTISQWNFLWSRGNGGCTYQTMSQSDAETHVGDYRYREVVCIKADGYIDMFGVVSRAIVTDLLDVLI